MSDVNKEVTYLLTYLNTSNDVVPGKEVPFGVSMTIFYIWTLKFPKKPPFQGPILTEVFLRPKTALT